MINFFVVCPECGILNRVERTKAFVGVGCGDCNAELPPIVCPQSVTTSDLRKVLGRSEGPVVVDFWAPWCAPCRVFSPVFERVAQELCGSVQCLKINTEENPDAERLFAVRSIPTIVCFQRNREVARQAGVMSPRECLEWIHRVTRPIEQPGPGAYA